MKITNEVLEAHLEVMAAAPVDGAAPVGIGDGAVIDETAGTESGRITSLNPTAAKKKA